jgi:hypothetical protein
MKLHHAGEPTPGTGAGWLMSFFLKHEPQKFPCVFISFLLGIERSRHIFQAEENIFNRERCQKSEAKFAA